MISVLRPVPSMGNELYLYSKHSLYSISPVIDCVLNIQIHAEVVD